MTVNDLIIKLASFNRPAAIVTLSAENESGDCFDGFVGDVVDISAETENGNTVCIMAKRD